MEEVRFKSGKRNSSRQEEDPNVGDRREDPE